MQAINSKLIIAKSSTSILLWVICFMALPLMGCGNPNIYGKVVFSDDQSPVQYGVVNFVTDDFIARGQIDKNGYYRIGTTRAGNGLPAGEYKIYISSTTLSIHPDEGGGYKTIIHPKYEKPETSGLELSVKGSQEFNIEVERHETVVGSTKKR
jgi:hypothetical protein